MATLERTEVYQFTSKLYRFLEDGHDIQLKKLRGYDGIIWKHDYPTVVKIDYRKELFSTIIHEAIHYLYPDWNETMVIRYEKRIVNALTNRQVKNILKRFAATL